MRWINRFCFHRWSFPRRCPQYQGQENVDVQTCVKCGAKRVARVQFGRDMAAPEVRQ